MVLLLDEHTFLRLGCSMITHFICPFLLYLYMYFVLWFTAQYLFYWLLFSYLSIHLFTFCGIKIQLKRNYGHKFKWRIKHVITAYNRFHWSSAQWPVADYQGHLLLLLFWDCRIAVDGFKILVSQQWEDAKRIYFHVSQRYNHHEASRVVFMPSLKICHGSHHFHKVTQQVHSKWLFLKPDSSFGILHPCQVKWVLWLFHFRWPPGEITLKELYRTSFIASLIDPRIEVPFRTELFGTSSCLGASFSVPDDMWPSIRKHVLWNMEIWVKPGFKRVSKGFQTPETGFPKGF